MKSRNPDYGINLHGDDFSVERQNIIVSKTKGFFCSNEYPNCIQLKSTASVKEGDWLIHDITSNRYFVKKINPLSSSNTIHGWMANYLTENEYLAKQNQKDQPTYSVGIINGSAIIGNQQNATINNGYNLSEIKSLISSKPIEDQELLNKLIERVEIITEDNQPVSKGTLAKFSDVLSKHSDIAIALGNSIINWLMGK